MTNIQSVSYVNEEPLGIQKHTNMLDSVAEKNVLKRIEKSLKNV